MTRTERLDKLKTKLLDRRKELRVKITGDLGSTDPNQQGDEGDAATYNASSDLNTRLASMESEELRQIELALGKFRDGRYGICEMSGKSIPIARLEALPFTRLSVECQRVQEESSHSDHGYNADWEFAVTQESRFQERDLTISDLRIDD
jgi:DnaK suppressor protein